MGADKSLLMLLKYYFNCIYFCTVDVILNYYSLI